MPKWALIFACLLVFALGVPPQSMAQSSDTQVAVDEIVISGNRRVAAGTVMSYLPVRVGDRVTRSSLSIALDRLYETGLFKDIDITLDGQVVRVAVVENPIINQVVFEGNGAISDDKLTEEVTLRQAQGEVSNWNIGIENLMLSTPKHERTIQGRGFLFSDCSFAEKY